MNNYELKKQARKERYEDLAASKRLRSEKLYESAKTMADFIPFGQPILVGHHSEKADRNFRGKIHNKFKQSFEEGSKADYYQNKAEHMSDCISSDDPEAITKLNIKLAGLQGNQDRMKMANAAARTGKYSKPYAAYQMTNNNATIRSVKIRIEQLTKAKNIDVRPDISYDDFILREDKDENRIQFIFSSIPSEEVRSSLKRRGFRWSPSNKAWQRQLNNAGRYAASIIVESLKK